MLEESYYIGQLKEWKELEDHIINVISKTWFYHLIYVSRYSSTNLFIYPLLCNVLCYELIIKCLRESNFGIYKSNYPRLNEIGSIDCVLTQKILYIPTRELIVQPDGSNTPSDRIDAQLSIYSPIGLSDQPCKKLYLLFHNETSCRALIFKHLSQSYAWI